MWIICGGAKRSGSTLQYNLLARLVEACDAGKRISHFKPEEFAEVIQSNKDYAGYKVVKLHTPPAALEVLIRSNEAVVFHCYRDLRDVVVSYISKGWMSADKADIQSCVNDYLDQLNLWKALHTDIHSRKYEDFAFDQTKELRHYAQVLGLELADEKLEQIAADLSLTAVKQQQSSIEPDQMESKYNNRFDRTTLVHSNHINNGYHNHFFIALNAEQIRQIEASGKEYMEQYGYRAYMKAGQQFISFSQHADDYIAWQLLGKSKQGVVVEVGAFDGVHLSNSFGLEKMGWRSVCVEPNPEMFQFLQEQRPNSANYNCAVVSTVETTAVDFYQEEIGVLSGLTFDEADVKRRYSNRGIEYKAPKKLQVPAKTLNAILASELAKGQAVDVLSIDVEGFELEVLKGLDLNNRDVKLFIIEANTPEERKGILEYFESYKDFVLIGSNIQNLFIAHKKHLKGKHLRALDFKTYVKAPQRHPVSDSLTIDSVPPRFVKSKYFDALTRRFKLF